MKDFTRTFLFEYIIYCLLIYLQDLHFVGETHFQYKFSISIWCGIIVILRVCPYEALGYFNGQEYLKILQNNLSVMSDDVHIM